MSNKRVLKLNWVESRPTLSGGIKSNRLIAEAMARRGHSVTTSFLPPSRPWPRPWRVRSFYKRLRLGIGEKHFPHHLQHGEITLNQMPTHRLDPSKIPDADVTFASWWAVWKQVQGWPESKGLKVHYVRHYELHGGDPEEVISAYKLPGPCVVISSWLQRVLEELGRKDIVRVPNGVDWTQFDSRSRMKSKRPTIGMLMGRSFKDTPTGLRAINRLQKKYPDLRVIAFGTMPIANEFEIPSCVEYHQKPLQDKIACLYQETDCWVITSSSEGFGMPGIEAMASHCPVVSTRCGGPSDFIREGINGFLVDVGDDEMMADRISTVLDFNESEWQRMSDSSYQIAQEFNWDISAKHLNLSCIVGWKALTPSGIHEV